MTTTPLGNILLNPGFSLWDYGTSSSLSALPSHGYLANRWKTARLGAGEGTVSRVLTGTSSTIPKWFRNLPSLQISLTSLSSEGTVDISQTVEQAFLWQRGLSVVSIVAAGPEGGRFELSLDGERVTIETRGETTFTTTNVPVLLGDTTTASGTSKFTVFTQPSMLGTYTVAFVQLRYGSKAPRSDGFELRPDALERNLCARYSRLIGAGIGGEATTTTTGFPVSHPVDMRVGPDFIPIAGQMAMVNVASGATVTNAAPTWTTGYKSTSGIRLVTTGWTGLTAGATYMITTPAVGLLHADY